MTKHAYIDVPIDADLKAEAEDILAGLGVEPTLALQWLYQEIVRHGGLPPTLMQPAES